jgi:uncharacterized membrane protein YphA (DoxX/SURF4 family)
MRLTDWAALTVRVLFGGLFVFSGLNKLVGFMPLPPMPEPATVFLGALAATGYMIPVIGAIEAVFGALIIAGRFVPLALTVLAPLVVNIAFFHVLLAPELPVVVFVLAAEGFLAWRYREAFAGLLQVTPEIASAQSVGAERGRGSTAAILS